MTDINIPQGLVIAPTLAPNIPPPDPATQRWVDRLATTYSVRPGQIETVVRLFDEGCSVPFIARYRRAETGDMPAEALFELQRSVELFNTLVTTKRNHIIALETRGVLTDSLRKKFESCTTMRELDTLWAPFIERKTSKAQKAKNVKGLEALAKSLFENRVLNVREQDLVMPKDCGFTLLEGIKYIITDIIAFDPTCKTIAQNQLNGFIEIYSKIKCSKDETKIKAHSKYLDYADFSKNLNFLTSHQILGNLLLCIHFLPFYSYYNSSIPLFIPPSQPIV